MIKFQIVIPFWNKPKDHIDNMCLNSILYSANVAKLFGNNFEYRVTIVDDGSSDSKCRIDLAEVVGNYRQLGMDVRVLRKDNNEGCFLARISGMTEAVRNYDFDYLINLDTDNSFKMSTFDKLCKAAKDKPEVITFNIDAYSVKNGYWDNWVFDYYSEYENFRELWDANDFVVSSMCGKVMSKATVATYLEKIKVVKEDTVNVNALEDFVGTLVLSKFVNHIKHIPGHGLQLAWIDTGMNMTDDTEVRVVRHDVSVFEHVIKKFLENDLMYVSDVVLSRAFNDFKAWSNDHEYTVEKFKENINFSDWNYIKVKDIQRIAAK